MKTRLLKKIRARFKIIRKGRRDAVILDLINQVPLYPFIDWTLSPYEAYKRFAISEVLGAEKYDKLKKQHRARAYNKARHRVFLKEIEGNGNSGE